MTSCHFSTFRASIKEKTSGFTVPAIPMLPTFSFKERHFDVHGTATRLLLVANHYMEHKGLIGIFMAPGRNSRTRISVVSKNLSRPMKFSSCSFSVFTQMTVISPRTCHYKKDMKMDRFMTLWRTLRTILFLFPSQKQSSFSSSHSSPVVAETSNHRPL